jgi:dolichol-phosphate mannosyltransferase
MLDRDRLDQSFKVSVILPTYNESRGIVELIKEINNELSGIESEIIIVDDDSLDGTASVVQKYFKDSPGIKVFVRKEDKGLSPSILYGIKKSTGSHILVMDSDFNHKPEYIPMMIQSLNYYSFVTGSRFLYGGRMDTRPRHFLSWCFNVFVRTCTGGSMTDNLYGFFACKRKTLFNYENFFQWIFRGFGEYFIRLLFLMERDHVSILQFPAINGKRRYGQGNLSFLKILFIYMKATLTCKPINENQK